jgi:hypothetical protein
MRLSQMSAAAVVAVARALIGDSPPFSLTSRRQPHTENRQDSELMRRYNQERKTAVVITHVRASPSAAACGRSHRWGNSPRRATLSFYCNVQFGSTRCPL